LALAQLSRNVEYRAENIPRLADLKESGAIESDADVVMLLHRPPDRPPNVLDIIVAKQRNGPTGEASVLFDRSSGRFSNLAPGG
jgi:replicative DNA helicase